MFLKKDVFNAKIKILRIKYQILQTQPLKQLLILKKLEVKDEIPSITNLATSTTALAVVENKTPNVRNLVEKLTIKQQLVKLK